MITTEDIQLSKMSYTDKDFASFYPDLLDLAKQLTDSWDPSLSNESDPGVVLLKEGAFISDHNNYNIDKNVLENFLPSATQETSVRNLVEMNGYTPRYYVSAKGLVNFTYNTSADDEVTAFNIPAFTLVISNEAGDVTYTQIEDFSIQEAGVKATCMFMEGTISQLTVNGSNTITLDNIDDNNRLYLPTKFVAQNGIFISNITATSQKSTYWTKQNYLLTQPTGSKVYKIDYDSSLGLPYIEFPSDIANIIESGLDIKYIVTTGINGNVKANTLNQVISPANYYISENVSIDTTKFTVSNPSSISNGKNPETIDQMYSSFKKIVGTFDTLVTCKDYADAIYTLVDDYDTKIISNDAVTDIKTDYNNAFNVISYDSYGTYFENASSCKGITSYNVEYNATESSETVDEGTITIDDGLIKVYKNGEWVELKSISYNDFVAASEAMSPFDICVYALKAFSMSDYISTNPSAALNNSFLPASQDTLKEITQDLEPFKCINHIIKFPEEGDVVCFKNYLPLNITVTPYSKVTKAEKDDIINNIYIALSENFNAAEVDFGEELDYDVVYDVIINADDRIKNIKLEDFEYNPKVMIMQADGTGKDEDFFSSKYLVDLVAKNVLAGRLCLFKFDNDFDVEFGQVIGDEDATVYNDVSSIASEVAIPVSASQSITTTTTTETYNFESATTANIKCESGTITIPAQSTYDLSGDEQVTIQLDGNNYVYNSNTYAQYGIINNTNASLTITSSFTAISYSDVSVKSYITVQNTDDNSINLDYTIKPNEYIQVAWPSYSTDVIFPTYVYYRFNSAIHTAESPVPKNSDYKLQAGESLILIYTQGDTTSTSEYYPGDVIKPSFNLVASDPNVGVKKSWTDIYGAYHENERFTALAAGEQIEHRVLLETVLDGVNTPCYWIRNNNGNILFDNGTSGGTREDSIILNSGEYFIYSNSVLDSMVILGAGTKITRSANDTTNWAAPNPISIYSISKEGYQSGVSWQYMDFSVNNLSLQEMNILTLGEADNVKIYNWSTASGAISNDWKICDGTIKYTLSDGSQAELTSSTEPYMIRSRLDLTSNNTTPQQLYPGQSVTITYNGGDTKTIEGSSAGEDVFLQTNMDFSVYGGSTVNISDLSDEEFNIRQFVTETPTVTIDGTTKELLSNNDTYAVTVEGSTGTITLPFAYTNTFGPYSENTREYIIPVFFTCENEDDVVPVTASISAEDSEVEVLVQDYNIGSAGSTLEMNKECMYLIRVCYPTPIDAGSESSEYTNDLETVNKTLRLILSWNNTPSIIEAVTIYNPKVVTGLNDNLSVDGNVTLDAVLNRINELLESANNTNIKPYYIYEPELSKAIQDDDVSNPNMFWDYNNIANAITIAQIDIDNSNIDITKSMRNYR